MPATSPNAPRASCSTTAAHSSRSGVTTSTTVSRASHSVLVATSTRSPALNTGPRPASICLITRKLMKASSVVQRRAQAVAR
jgi:hypothetical protein